MFRCSSPDASRAFPWTRRRAVVSILLSAALVALGGCAVTSRPPVYAPRERQFVITAVPLLTKETLAIYPFLREDFARGGVLEGKEVYAFVPSTLTAVEGDTIHFTFVNPEDDAHNFVLSGLSVELPGQSVTRADWRADRAGIFTFACTVPAHTPEMYGQLVVLPASVGRELSAPNEAER
jgi:plastocyanin